MENNGTNINRILSTIITWALFFTFMILKLCSVINWSWWWVTAPLWITAGLELLVLFIATIIVLAQRIKFKKWLDE